jgi:D-threo-aldose 1-dehydrogenase
MAVRTVALGTDKIETSALGFGCANIFRLPGGAQRSSILAAAYDAGVRHFDVAPMYGLGLAEHELGAWAHRRRDSVVIATKFGIRPTAAARGLARIQGPVRRTFELLPALREQARASAVGPGSGPAGSVLYAAEGYDAAAAKRSLHRSLRSLRTDYVDLFLLHDPVPASVRSEDVCAYLDGARTAGSIRTWGIAGETEQAIAVADSLSHTIPVMQLHDDIFLRAVRYAESGGTGHITFGVLGKVLNRVVEYVSGDDARRKRWSAEIGADCGVPETAAALLLKAALRENTSGVVLFSTIRPKRVYSAVASAQTHDGPDPVLDAFIRLVDSELRAAGSAAGDGDR